MAARIVEACDAMIERWQSLLEAGDATTFDRVYLPDILDAEFQEALANLTGRHVYVMPVNYGQAELATRQADLNQHSPAVLVFPTHVGVNRVARVVNAQTPRVPHACGGEPEDSSLRFFSVACSPRMWG